MRFCKQPGCPRLVETGYCADHAKAKPDPARVKVADPFYVSVRWRKLRARYISGHPLCELCGEIGVIVHHKIEMKKGGSEMDEANLQTVCRECHEGLHHRKNVRTKVYSY